MATEQQIAANRRNAQSSTGPKTPEGKAAVRFNALTLGLSAKAVIVGENDQASLHQICENLLASFPDEDQRYLMEEIAVTRLELARIRSLEARLVIVYQNQCHLGDNLNSIDQLSRVKVRLQRHIEKCAATLRSVYHPKPSPPPQKMQNQSQFVENLDTPAPEPPAPEPPASSRLPEKMRNQTQSVENFNIWTQPEPLPPPPINQNPLLAGYTPIPTRDGSIRYDASPVIRRISALRKARYAKRRPQAPNTQHPEPLK